MDIYIYIYTYICIYIYIYIYIVLKIDIRNISRRDKDKRMNLVQNITEELILLVILLIV